MHLIMKLSYSYFAHVFSSVHGMEYRQIIRLELGVGHFNCEQYFVKIMMLDQLSHEFRPQYRGPMRIVTSAPIATLTLPNIVYDCRGPQKKATKATTIIRYRSEISSPLEQCEQQHTKSQRKELTVA
jgi:hypothetical protein